MFGDTLRQFTTFKLSWWYCLPSGASQIDFISGFEVNEYRKAYFMIFLFEIFLALWSLYHLISFFALFQVSLLLSTSSGD